MPVLSDIFNQRPFQAVELTAAIDQIDYVPSPLGGMGERLFPTRRVRTRTIAIAKRNNRYEMVPTSPIGAPPVEWEPKGRDIRPFVTRRLAKGTTILAESLQGILSLPMMEQVSSVQQELADRARDIREDMDLTQENMRLGALMGRVYDADGSLLDDWYQNWGEAEPAAVEFNLDVTTTNVRAKCQLVRRRMKNLSKGGWVDGRTEVHALADSTFFDALITHPMVEKYWMGYQAGQTDLRGEAPADEFRFGGITWHDYRSADDGSTLTPLAEGQVQFFPVGGRDVFERYLAPAEFIPFINRPGQEIYAMTIPDRDRQAWVRFECYVYPLYVCLRPYMLFKGWMTTEPAP